jgi:hypothetical protein
MSEQTKDGQIIVKTEYIVNKRGEIVSMRVNVYVTHCFEEVSVDIKAFLETNAEKCMLIPIGSVVLFAGEARSTESVKKKFNRIVDLITEARKFTPTLNDILTAIKDMADGIKAKYDEKITLGEVV